MDGRELQQRVKDYVMTNKPHGREKLAVGAGVSFRTVNEVMNKGHVPKEENALAIVAFLEQAEAGETA